MFFRPMQGSPDFGIWKMFASGIRSLENFACGIWNRGLGNPE